MCIIAIQPKGVKISEQTLKNCWNANNDGVGIMYAKYGKIQVFKEMHNFNQFMKIKKQADKLDVNIVMHFRIATSGGINERNCHPFKIHDELYFCHNGILDIEVPFHSKLNDTQLFNNTFMKGLPHDFTKNNAIMQLIEFTIGNRNKFVFLDSLGEFNILNEIAGTWDNGAWYSNNSYKTQTFYKRYNPHKLDEDLIECEGCGELNDINDMIEDNYYDMHLCKKCHSFEYELEN